MKVQGKQKAALDKASGGSAVKPCCSCKIEIRANKLSSLGYYHLFVVFTDESGKEFYYRGGPSAGGPGGSSGLSGELSGGSSHNSSGSSSSGHGSNPSSASDSSGAGDGGPFGFIVTESGRYLPGTIDYEPGAKSVLIAEGPEVCPLRPRLDEQMRLIEASHTRYNPLGPNSNSTAYTAVRNVGLTPRVPGGVWAPGKDVVISTRP